MTAPNATELALGDTVAVFGLGLVGNLAAQLYRLRGARVIGVDPVGTRCDLAREVGIDCVVDVPPSDQVEAVKEATGGEGAQVTVDATGLTPVCMTCVQATALFGQVVLLGSPRAAMEGNLTDVFGPIHMNGLVVRGAHMWRMPVTGDRNVRQSVEWAFATVFDLIARGDLKVRELISHVIAPDGTPAAYDGLQNSPNDYTGVVIDWRHG
jgi:threonine dehydrogenase-like Zn-dependent dehydrogenase